MTLEYFLGTLVPINSSTFGKPDEATLSVPDSRTLVMTQLREFNKRFSIFLLLGLLAAGSALAQQVFDVKKYGAKGRKTDNAQKAIQKAIDAAAEAGGGTVYFGPGEYTTSTVFLKNNVGLHLEAGAFLYATRDSAAYTFTKGIYSTETDVPILIYGENLNRISITGRGTIDGQGEQVWEKLREVDKFIEEETENARASGVEMKRAYATNPKVCMIYLVNCKDVKVLDVTLTRSPNWTLHLANCDRVNIRGIYLYSSLEKGVNADGIDIDGCRDVTISDCVVHTGDDAICLKSTRKGDKFFNCENITINNCALASTSTALKIGTESHGSFKNIVFTNSAIKNTNRGIGIFVRDGGVVDRVVFSNLTIECNRKHFNWWGDGDPIRFVLLKRIPNSRLGAIRNVIVENVVATGQGTSLIAGFADNLKEGLPSKDLENITLSNVYMHMQAEMLPDKRAKQGLLVKNVNGLRMTNVQVSWDTEPTEPKWTHALELNDVANAQLSGLNLRQGLFTQDTIAAMRLHNVRQTVVRNNTAAAGCGIYARITGSNTRQVEVESRPMGMLLARKPYSIAPEVSLQEIVGFVPQAARPAPAAPQPKK